MNRAPAVVVARRAAVLCIAVMLIAAPALAQPRPAQSLAAWLDDLDSLVATIRTHHVAPYTHISQEEFDRRVTDVRSKLARTERDGERSIHLASLAASIGDGHTNLQVYGRLDRLPIRLFWFGGELRIVGTPTEQRRLLGRRVIRVGGWPVADAAARVGALVAQHESEMFVRNWTQLLLRIPDVLRIAGNTNVADTVALTLRDDDGREWETAVAAVSPEADQALAIERPRSRTPLADSRPDETFWFERVPGTSLMYFNFSGYPERQTMRRTADALVTALSSGDIRTVLVDMRRNGGGNFKIGRQLIDMLQPQVAQHAVTLSVAIGRETFSAGVTNATDFKQAFKALYLGEVSGARPNGPQENFAFELPYSKLRGSVAQEIYRFQDADTDGLQPDVILAPSWDAYAAGRDTVLEWAIGRTREGRDAERPGPRVPELVRLEPSAARTTDAGTTMTKALPRRARQSAIRRLIEAVSSVVEICFQVSAFPYNASNRVHAFSACGSL